MAYRKIEDSKLTAVANAIREKLGTTVTMKPDAMPDLIRGIGIGYIPIYWQSYLPGKATEIDAALNTAGENRSAFLWYTDAHWTTNYGMSPMILKYLIKHTGMEKTFFGGDIANATSGEVAALTAWQELVKDIPNHHSVIGNHDNQVTDFATAEARADFFIMSQRTGDMVMGTDATNGKMYYYIDNHIEKTRYICLSTGRMWTTSDEIPWCIDALKSTPANWHIVIISHLWLNNDYSDNGATLNTTPPDYAKSYLDMFDAYNYKQTGTTSFGSVPYDFADAVAKIEFIIGGHIHRDYDFTTATGIPVILTECDERQERDPNSTATQGTTTENCVYAIVADYAANVVNVINVGRGHTRSLAIPDVVRYTNALKKAIGTDGKPFNGGLGYKEKCRLSNGAETSASYFDTTGFIKATRGDTIRLRNVTFCETTYEKSSVACYDANFIYLQASPPFTTPETVNAAWNPVASADGKDVVQFTIPTTYNAQTQYIRIVCSDLNEDSIITVNEEIQ